jgi:hypothetical protein
MYEFMIVYRLALIKLLQIHTYVYAQHDIDDTQIASHRLSVAGAFIFIPSNRGFTSKFDDDDRTGVYYIINLYVCSTYY